MVTIINSMLLRLLRPLKVNMASPSYLEAASRVNPDLIMTLKSEYDELRSNAHKDKYPCIYLSKVGDLHCHQFVGKIGGSSKRVKSRPKYKFKALPNRHYVAHVLDFVFRINRPNPVYEFEDSNSRPLELSHLCHNLWCVNPSHLVRETHTINCQRRDQCSRRHCSCKEENRTPECAHD